MSEMERWVSVDDIAEHLGVARDTIYRWIDARGLPASKVGRSWKAKLSEVDRWVRDGGATERSVPLDEARV
jgi:excisionase family DNA binding protein